MKDRSVRRVIFDYLEENYGKIRIFEESPIKNSRCDFYTVTDRLTGYEIKSDADSYERLSGQIKDYDAFFDENYIVIGRTHRAHVAEKVPPYWGIICITDEEEGFIVETVRPAEKNPKMKRKNHYQIWEEQQNSDSENLAFLLVQNHKEIIERIQPIVSEDSIKQVMSLLEKEFENYF